VHGDTPSCACPTPVPPPPLLLPVSPSPPSPVFPPPRPPSPSPYRPRRCRPRRHRAYTHTNPLQVVLVTNDQANLKLALAGGLTAVTMRQFVHSVEAQFPSLVDLLAAGVDSAAPAADSTGEGVVDAAGAGAGGVSVSGMGVTMYYPAHVPMSKLQEGLKTGKYRSGTIRMARDSWSEGTVNVVAPDGDFLAVAVAGRENTNRATEVRVSPAPSPLPPAPSFPRHANAGSPPPPVPTWKPPCFSLDSLVAGGRSASTADVAGLGVAGGGPCWVGCCGRGCAG
jgi:hypothetical protein